MSGSQTGRPLEQLKVARTIERDAAAQTLAVQERQVDALRDQLSAAREDVHSARAEITILEREVMARPGLDAHLSASIALDAAREDLRALEERCRRAADGLQEARRCLEEARQTLVQREAELEAVMRLEAANTAHEAHDQMVREVRTADDHAATRWARHKAAGATDKGIETAADRER